jgi:hypothetical protein
MTALQNIKLTYLYRDAANYKAWGTVIFANHERLALDDIEKRIRRCLFDEVLFVADQVCIPNVFLFTEWPFSKDDHFYHEFDSVKFTAEQATDLQARSITKFIEQFEGAYRNGWHPEYGVSHI